MFAGGQSMPIRIYKSIWVITLEAPRPAIACIGTTRERGLLMNLLCTP